jgi:hypothetical protein
VNKFKVGDEVIISEVTNSYSGKLTLGSLAVVGEFNHNCTFARMIGELNIMCGWHNLANIKHAEKWSIYNNTLPWSELSDKQKGKLMVAENDGYEIEGVKCTALNKPVRFDCHHIAYFAVEPEPPKPEPTMEELFLIDWKDCLCVGGKQEQKMIAKGWTKTCK